jgi:flagellar biosynthetic protein FliR
MSIDALLTLIPAYVLVVFRLAGMMLFAPFFGSSRIPKRVKVLICVVAALGMVGGVKPVALPGDLWTLTMGIGGEIVFGLAMGLSLSVVFIAVQWAGEMIGQQIGFNISEVLDPQFGGSGSLMGDLYFWLAVIIFLLVGGHHALLRGVHDSLTAVPLLSAGAGEGLVDNLFGLLTGATVLAFRLAGPMFVTMLVVDLAMGCIGRTMPQFNIMTAGLSLRVVVGMVVVICGALLTSDVLTTSLLDGIDNIRLLYVTKPL